MMPKIDSYNLPSMKIFIINKINTNSGENR